MPKEKVAVKSVEEFDPNYELSCIVKSVLEAGLKRWDGNKLFVATIGTRKVAMNVEIHVKPEAENI